MLYIDNIQRLMTYLFSNINIFLYTLCIYTFSIYIIYIYIYIYKHLNSTRLETNYISWHIEDLDQCLSEIVVYICNLRSGRMKLALFAIKYVKQKTARIATFLLHVPTKLRATGV